MGKQAGKIQISKIVQIHKKEVNMRTRKISLNQETVRTRIVQQISWRTLARPRNFGIAVVAVVLFLVLLVVFQINTTEYAIVSQFGQPVRSITEPGLYVKLPDPFNSIIRLDKRTQIYNLSETELLTKDKKNILVEAYAAWQVDDPVQFYKSVRDTQGASARLSDILTSELGVSLGQYDLTNLVTIDPKMMKMSEMTTQLTKQTNERTTAYGFKVTDVRLKQINFPEANRQSVFQRMRAERQQIARQLRSEGTEESTKIRAEADGEKTTLLSKAQEEANRIKGEGEAESIRIYAQSFGQNPDFYQFLRTLESYDKIINKGTTLILPSNSELLKYLNP